MNEWLMGFEAVAGLTLLRIGLPLLLLAVVVFGYHWIEENRWVKAMAGLRMGKLGDPVWRSGVIGALKTPCYEEKGCDKRAVAKCPSRRHPDTPCWAMREVAEGYIPAECYNCKRFIQTRQLEEIL